MGLSLVLGLAVDAIGRWLMPDVDLFSGAPLPLAYGGVLLLQAPAWLALTHLFLRGWEHLRWRDLFGRWDGRATSLSGMLRSMGTGYACGLVLLGVLLSGALIAGRLKVVGVSAAGGVPVAAVVAAVLLGACVQGGTEEVIYRGYLLRALERWQGPRAAVLLSGICFGLLHGLNPGAGAISILNVTLVGLFLGGWRLRSTLWEVIGFHSAWNAVLVLLSMPVSGIDFNGPVQLAARGPAIWTGGAFGIEAGLAATVLFAVAAALVWPGGTAVRPGDRVV